MQTVYYADHDVNMENPFDTRQECEDYEEEYRLSQVFLSNIKCYNNNGNRLGTSPNAEFDWENGNISFIEYSNIKQIDKLNLLLDNYGLQEICIDNLEEKGYIYYDYDIGDWDSFDKKLKEINAICNIFGKQIKMEDLEE